MPKILLVDDSATDRRLFSGLLEKEANFTVESSENGLAALKLVDSVRPDVVVTDMQMPDMDGLQLVTELRQRCPHIPVILITSQGSEALAAKALKQGAAGYVPKSQSSELLRDTVSHVFELSQAEASYERLIGCATISHFEFILENDPALIPPLLDLAQRMIGSMELCDPTACLQVGVALEHAILNAMYRGNLELPGNTSAGAARAAAAKSPHKDRRVHVAIRITREEARFVVRDEGPGFDIKEVTAVGLSTSLTGKAGRGLLLMWSFMDKVSFDETGNTVTLIKSRADVDAEQVSTPPETAEQQEGTADKFVLPEVLGELVARSDSTSYRLAKTRITVGREPSCDIVINSGSVSHHHCVLFLHEGWWYVNDLDSKNGVKVNSKPVKQHLVPPAATLSVGSVDLTIKYQPHELGSPGITPPIDPF